MIGTWNGWSRVPLDAAKRLEWHEPHSRRPAATWRDMAGAWISVCLRLSSALAPLVCSRVIHTNAHMHMHMRMPSTNRKPRPLASPNQIVAAARDTTRKPVLIFGEPGLAKDNVAALVHFGSSTRSGPLVKVRG